MAVVITKSAEITNRDASPMVKNNSNVEAGMVRSCVGVAAVANGDSIGSVYPLCVIPSNARVDQVLILNDAITAAAGSVGLYRTTAEGGAAVSAGLFAVGASLATASTAGVDLTHAATGAFLIANAEKPLWQALGLAADPSLTYVLAVTLTAAATAGGSVVAKVRYAI